MTVKIEIYGEDAKEALFELRDFSVGLQGRAAQIGVAEAQNYAAEPAVLGAPTPNMKAAAQDAIATGTGFSKTTVDEAGDPETSHVPVAETTASDFRERGKAPEGKSRRTKAEIAEDEELDALVAKSGADSAKVDEAVRQKGHATVIAEIKEHMAGRGNISADSENRTDPGQTDDPATEAQDAADEKAEVEATGKEFTREDVRAAMTGYVQKYGIAVTQEDGPKIFLEALGKPPAGEDYWKLSLLPEDPETLAKVIAVWKRAVEENPLEREVVGA